MRKAVVVAVAVCLAAGSAWAQLIVDPAQQAAAGRIEAGGVLSMSTIEYEVDGGTGIGGDADIDRTIIGAYGASGVSDMLDIYGALGIIAKAEVDGADDSGTGFLLAGGGRMDVMDISMLDILLYAQAEYISEDYGDGVDGTILEISGGVVGRYALAQGANVYGALDLIPFSDGEVEMSGFTTDFERDSLFGIRLGGNYDLGNFWIRGELALMGEETITIGAGTYF